MSRFNNDKSSQNFDGSELNGQNGDRYYSNHGNFQPNHPNETHINNNDNKNQLNFINASDTSAKSGHNVTSGVATNFLNLEAQYNNSVNPNNVNLSKQLQSKEGQNFHYALNQQYGGIGNFDNYNNTNTMPNQQYGIVYNNNNNNSNVKPPKMNDMRSNVNTINPHSFVNNNNYHNASINASVNFIDQKFVRNNTFNHPNDQNIDYNREHGVKIGIKNMTNNPIDNMKPNNLKPNFNCGNNNQNIPNVNLPFNPKIDSTVNNYNVMRVNGSTNVAPTISSNDNMTMQNGQKLQITNNNSIPVSATADCSYQSAKISSNNQTNSFHLNSLSGQALSPNDVSSNQSDVAFASTSKDNSKNPTNNIPNYSINGSSNTESSTSNTGIPVPTNKPTGNEAAASDSDIVAKYSKCCNVLTSFMDWSTSAIISRRSLIEVAFVVFIDLWTKLFVSSPAYANDFLNKFKQYFNEIHSAEIDELSSVKSKTSLNDYCFVQRVLRNEKFYLPISPLTRKLLSTRLSYEGETLILHIFQKRIVFDTLNEACDNSYTATLTGNAISLNGLQKNGEFSTIKDLNEYIGLPVISPVRIDTDTKTFPPGFQNGALAISSSMIELYPIPNLSLSDTTDCRINMFVSKMYQDYLGRKRFDKSDDAFIECNNLDILNYKIQNTNDISFVEISNDGEAVASGELNSSCVWINKILTGVWNRCTGAYTETVTSACSNKYDFIMSAPNHHSCLLTACKRVTGFKFCSEFMTSGDFLLGLSSSLNGSLTLWDLQLQSPIYKYDGYSPAISLDVDMFGYQFLSSHYDDFALLWNMSYNSPIRSFTYHCSTVSNSVFHPNSMIVATVCSIEKTVCLWDTRINDIIANVTCDHSYSKSKFSPNGRYLYLYGQSKTVSIYDLAERRKIKTVEFASIVNDLTCANGSDLFAVALKNQTVAYQHIFNDKFNSSITLKEVQFGDDHQEVLNTTNTQSGGSVDIYSDVLSVQFTNKNVLITCSV